MPKFPKKPPTDPALSARAKAAAALLEPHHVEQALRRQPAQTCPSAKLATSDVREPISADDQAPALDLPPYKEKAWTISVSPKSLASVLWPVGYVLAFVGGCVSIGLGIAISSETYKLVLPWADRLVASWQG